MPIVWDEPKRQTNIERHGLDFADVDIFDWDGAMILPGRLGRLKAVGSFGGRLCVVIFAKLGTEAYSIVSFRPASKKEREIYANR